MLEAGLGSWLQALLGYATEPCGAQNAQARISGILDEAESPGLQRGQRSVNSQAGWPVTLVFLAIVHFR